MLMDFKNILNIPKMYWNKKVPFWDGPIQGIILIEQIKPQYVWKIYNKSYLVSFSN